MYHRVVLALLWADEFLECLVEFFDNCFAPVVQSDIQIEACFCTISLEDAGAKGTEKGSINWSQLQRVACVLVLAAQDSDSKETLKLNSSSRALVTPVTLRDLRGAIVESLQSNLNRE